MARIFFARLKSLLMAMVGSANLNYRSCDLNIEVNAMVYGIVLNTQLRTAFFEDLKHTDVIDAAAWLRRPKHVQLWGKLVRLLAPFR